MTNKTWYKYSERKPRLDFSRIRVRRGVVVADVGRALREYLRTHWQPAKPPPIWEDEQ